MNQKAKKFSESSELEDYKAFIKSVFDRYSILDDDTFSNLLEMAQIQHLEKNEILLPIGTIARNIYILLEGVVVSNFLCKEGNEYHKNIFLKGHFLGSTVSYLTNTPSEFSLKSIEKSVVVGFNYKEYRKLINRYSDLKDFYIAYLEKNWVIDKEKREVDIILKDAGQRYRELIHEFPDLEQSVPLHYIASHLGITPTQLSRIRKKLDSQPM